MKIVSIIQGVGTQLRSLAMVFSHAWRPRETLNYPEQAVYAAPRYRGRIVLTRDPDGDERCVACNLCAVACPVGCISLQNPSGKMVAGIRSSFASTSLAASSAACVKRLAPPPPYS
ncbi:hypothetical protein A6767_15570 [Aeromonas veronii]|nr:hypothetical protein A6767_15570 [Aeromonas veronii]